MLRKKSQPMVMFCPRVRFKIQISILNALLYDYAMSA